MTLDLKLPKAKGLFIMGTDTGVGKTLVTGGIAHVLTEKGLNVGVIKPLVTGCRKEGDELIAGDAEFLAACAQADYPLSTITPVRFEIPAAPTACLMHEDRVVDYDAIVTAYKFLCETCDIVLVEGIGGVMVPIDNEHTILDLAVQFDLPAVIVARPNLGTINHSLLTIEAVRNAGLPVAGVVISGYDEQTADIPEQTAPGIIEQFGQTQILTIIPKDEDSSVEECKLGEQVIESLSETDWQLLASF